MSILLRRGTDAERALITFLEGELVYSKDIKKVFIGDGTTLGGIDLFNLHDHNSIYYTQLQVNTILLNYVSTTNFDSHVNDNTIHRVINDVGITTIDLWSANKIINELNQKSDLGHNHDSLYYTETEIDNFLNALNDQFVKISNSDTVEGFLSDKLTLGQGIISSILNPGNNESLEIKTEVYIDLIGGFSHPVYLDNTKTNKVLTVATHTFLYSEAAIGNNDWIQIGTARDAQSGHIMPYNGTIVGCSLSCEDDNGNTKDIRLYINGTLNSVIVTTTGSSGDNLIINNSLNIDFNSLDKLRLRGGTGSGTIQDTVVTLYVKWRV